MDLVFVFLLCLGLKFTLIVLKTTKGKHRKRKRAPVGALLLGSYYYWITAKPSARPAVKQ